MKDSKFTVAGVALVALILGILYTLYFAQGQSRPEIDVETYVRSKLTQEDVVPGLVPAAIYFKRPDMAEEQFCCVGTLCPDSKGNPHIITAEHIFRTDIRSDQIMSVRALRGNMEPPVVYIGRIVATGKELGSGEERDIVIAALDLRPTAIKPYSTFLSDEMAQSFWVDVVIGGKKIPRLRSLLSGEYVETVGYTRRGEEKTGAIFVVINCSARPGESGTGYVDDFGGLWVLHSGAGSKEIENQACEESRRVTGKDITGISTVSGPLFGQYK